MAAVTVSLCFSFLLFVFVCVSAEQKSITGEPGQSITLTCGAPDNDIRVIKWSRPDQGDKYVLLYRDSHFVPDDQHPSFKNRVELQDRQMKDGNVSLILKNVMIDDTGTYECRVFTAETRSLQLMSSITLSVVAPPGQPGGSVGLKAGLSVSAVLLVVVAAAAGFFIYRQQSKN